MHMGLRKIKNSNLYDVLYIDFLPEKLILVFLMRPGYDWPLPNVVLKLLCIQILYHICSGDWRALSQETIQIAFIFGAQPHTLVKLLQYLQLCSCHEQQIVKKKNEKKLWCYTSYLHSLEGPRRDLIGRSYYSYDQSQAPKVGHRS